MGKECWDGVDKSALGREKKNRNTSDKPCLRLLHVRLYIRPEVFKLIFASAMIHVIGSKANNMCLLCWWWLVVRGLVTLLINIY